jgi:hypothetical protein
LLLQLLAFIVGKGCVVAISKSSSFERAVLSKIREETKDEMRVRGVDRNNRGVMHSSFMNAVLSKENEVRMHR